MNMGSFWLIFLLLNFCDSLNKNESLPGKITIKNISKKLNNITSLSTIPPEDSSSVEGLENATTTEEATESTTIAPGSKNLSLHKQSPSPSLAKEIKRQSSKRTCTCDLQIDYCDINCCCDKDCNINDKMIFGFCLKEDTEHYDTRYCKYMQYIYSNHTPYEWEVNQNGLFCIVKNNLPPHHILQEKKTISSLNEAKQYKNSYEWPLESDGKFKESFNESDVMSFGQSIWGVTNGSALQIFELPNNWISTSCLSTKAVKYLQDFKSKCFQTRSLCLDYFTSFKSIIANCHAFNRNWTINNFKECPRNVCLPIQYKICHNNLTNCVNLVGNDTKSSSCESGYLVKSVRYNFYHNGSQGFVKSEAFLILSNDTKNEILQEIEVKFFWHNHTQNFSSVLSGNPGYIHGKPILTATVANVTQTINKTGSNVTQSSELKVEQHFDKKTKNFLLLPKNVAGACVLDENSHEIVKFKENLFTKCKASGSVQIAKENSTAKQHCEQVQKALLKFFPIELKNDSFKIVGSFGNANRNSFKDWLPIYSNKNFTQLLNSTEGRFSVGKDRLMCKNTTLYLRINVFHSRIDFQDVFNQEKIIAVTFEFVDGFDLDVLVFEQKQIVYEEQLKVAVTFFDVTSKKVLKYADPPSLEIKWPYDFFYPFIKVEHNKGKSILIHKWYHHSVLVGCVVVLLLA